MATSGRRLDHIWGQELNFAPWCATFTIWAWFSRWLWMIANCWGHSRSAALKNPKLWPLIRSAIESKLRSAVVLFILSPRVSSLHSTRISRPGQTTVSPASGDFTLVSIWEYRSWAIFVSATVGLMSHSPTLYFWRTSSKPPMWSASQCVTTATSIVGSSQNISWLKHSKTASFGPESMRIRLDPYLMRIASPCPTSQATILNSKGKGDSVQPAESVKKPRKNSKSLAFSEKFKFGE